MNLLSKHVLRYELTQSPQTISYLVAKTRGIEKLARFFDWMVSDPRMIFPIMMQGDDNPDFDNVFQGQPVVWDGRFYLNDKGELMYKGYAGASGFGGDVERIVKITDQVMAG